MITFIYFYCRYLFAFHFPSFHSFFAFYVSLSSMELFLKAFEVSLMNKASPSQTLFALKVQNQLTSTAEANCYHLTAVGKGGQFFTKKSIKVTIRGRDTRAGLGMYRSENSLGCFLFSVLDANWT